MLILAFDTTGARCAAALWRDGVIVAERAQPMEQGHAEALVPLLNAVMYEARCRYDALDRIAVTVGPGSFTGVRVGIATARAMGLSADRPVIGITTTEALATAVADANSDRRILSAIDTKRGDLYVQMFDNAARPLNEPVSLPPPELAAWAGPGMLVIAGDGATIAANVLKPQTATVHADAFPEPAIIARIAAARDPMMGAPLPLYIRPPEATLPKDGGRLRP